MANINELVREYGNLNDVLKAIREEYIAVLVDDLDEMDYYDTYEILNELNDDFHKMDELDDVFDYMTVTEILEQLSNIDTADDYFDADTKRSGDDPWDIAGIDKNQLARQFYDGTTDIEPTDEIITTLRMAEQDRDEAVRAFKIYDTARALFDQALKEDPRELVNVLWNINNN